MNSQHTDHLLLLASLLKQPHHSLEMFGVWIEMIWLDSRTGIKATSLPLMTERLNFSGWAATWICGPQISLVKMCDTICELRSSMCSLFDAEQTVKAPASTNWASVHHHILGLPFKVNGSNDKGGAGKHFSQSCHYRQVHSSFSFVMAKTSETDHFVLRLLLSAEPAPSFGPRRQIQIVFIVVVGLGENRLRLLENFPWCTEHFSSCVAESQSLVSSHMF